MTPASIRQSVLDQIAYHIKFASDRVSTRADVYLRRGIGWREAFSFQSMAYGLVIIKAGPTAYRILNTIVSFLAFKKRAENTKTDRSYQHRMTSPARLPRRNK